MKILAIDQSFTSCGIVILEDGIMTHFSLFTTDKSEDIFHRAWSVTTHLKGVAEEHKPDHIVMEGLAFSKFGNATRDLAGLQFVIVSVLRFMEGYDMTIISPNTVKKVATGMGNCKKIAVYEACPMDVIAKFLSIGATKTKGLYDLSDAYWIGQAGIIEIEKKLDVDRETN